MTHNALLFIFALMGLIIAFALYASVTEQPRYVIGYDGTDRGSGEPFDGTMWLERMR